MADREVSALLEERGQTHGAFADNAFYGQTLRLLFRQSKGWTHANDVQREALDMLACKLSRILSGQPEFVDHWNDGAGYFTLGARACDGDLSAAMPDVTHLDSFLGAAIAATDPPPLTSGGANQNQSAVTLSGIVRNGAHSQ